jgi:hypothetical protein
LTGCTGNIQELEVMAEQENQDQKEKKLIIDEDWKQEAQHDKEVLASQEEAEKEADQEQERTPGALPPGNFAALVSMLVTQALFAMGMLNIEGQEQREPDLNLAKYNIDMLESLEEKTKGNLSEEEEKVLTDMLNQVRMAYVKIAG